MNSRSIIVVILVIICIAFLAFFSFKDGFVIVNKISQSSLAKIFQSSFEYSDDIAALGYPGQRKMVIGDNETIYVVYRKKIKGTYEVCFSKFKDDGFNSKDEIVISKIGNDTHQRVPSLAMGQNGNLHVVWYGADPKNNSWERQIKYSNSLNGGKKWSEWINIAIVEGWSGEDYWQEHPSILAGRDNALYVVWEGKDIQNEHQQIKFSKSLDGGKTWNKWTNINVSPNNSQSRPSIVQDSSGRLYVFMYSSLGVVPSQQIWMSCSDDNGITWGAWNRVSLSNGDSRHVSVAIDSRDNIHVVWRAFNVVSEKTDIIYSEYIKNEDSFTFPKVVFQQSEEYQFFPNITVTAKNSPIIAWMQSAEASSFPKERPLNGAIHLYDIDTQEHFLVGEGVYPNLADTIKSLVDVPIVFTQTNDSSIGNIVLKFIEQ